MRNVTTEDSDQNTIHQGVTHIVAVGCAIFPVLGSYNGIYSSNVMLVYIRVSVVLSKSLCRKEREKLDITLDSMVVMLARVKEI